MERLRTSSEDREDNYKTKHQSSANVGFLVPTVSELILVILPLLFKALAG